MVQSTAAGESNSTARGRLTLGAGLGAVVTVIGAVVGAGKLSDNSFFTHLATGRIILDTGSVPSVDPYTYTAVGEPWTVQSWLASVIYALADRGLGLAGPRLVHVVLAAIVAAGCWWLARACTSAIPRVAVVGLAIGVGGVLWVERPLMIGLACFVGLWVVVERGPIWTVLPLMWVWVNSHGSFPLGLVLVATLIVGRRLDGADTGRLWRVAGMTAAGIVIGGVLSPVGLSLLTFPVTLLERTDQLQAVPEWRSPDFATWGARIFLLQLVLGMLAARRVDRWELVLPATAFAGAALLGMRNVPLAAIALTPLLAAAAPRLGGLRTDARVPLGGALVGLSAASCVILAASLARGPHVDLSAFPMAEIVQLEEEGVLPDGDERVAYIDRAGNYLGYRYGPIQNVFFDDRFDMYPREVLQDAIDLHRGRRVLEVLDTYEIDVVVWMSDSAVAERLGESDEWVADPPLPPLHPDLAADDGTSGWSIFRRAD